MRAACLAAQEESKWWGLMIPYAIGYPLWLSSLFVRIRVLVFIHLKGKSHLSPALCMMGGICATFFAGTMRVELIGHFKPCMTDIYLHI